MSRRESPSNAMKSSVDDVARAAGAIEIRGRVDGQQLARNDELQRSSHRYRVRAVNHFGVSSWVVSNTVELDRSSKARPYGPAERLRDEQQLWRESYRCAVHRASELDDGLRFQWIDLITR